MLITNLFELTEKTMKEDRWRYCDFVKAKIIPLNYTLKLRDAVQINKKMEMMLDFMGYDIEIKLKKKK